LRVTEQNQIAFKYRTRSWGQNRTLSQLVSGVQSKGQSEPARTAWDSEQMTGLEHQPTVMFYN